MMNSEMSNGNKMRRVVLIIGGTALGLFFLFLAFRDITWHEFWVALGQIKYIYLIPGVVVAILIQLVRALRFGLIVSPFCSLQLKDLWDLMNIWAVASIIMPARLGEFVRPYLLQERGASFSSGFGAVIVERFFDLSGLLLLLGIVLWTTPEVPRMYSFLGEVLLAILALAYLFVLIILARREKVDVLAKRMLSILPERASNFLGGILGRFIDGLGIMASFKQASIIFLYSVGLWVLFSGLTYLFLLAFSIKAPFLVAVTIQVFICFGVALPSAPGFIGTFHAAGRYALTLFGIQALAAVSFATVYHFFSLIVFLILGVISYFTCRFSFDQKIIKLPSKAIELVGTEKLSS